MWCKITVFWHIYFIFFFETCSQTSQYVTRSWKTYLLDKSKLYGKTHWKFSTYINFFAHLDKAPIKPSCCKVSHPKLLFQVEIPVWIIISDHPIHQKSRFPSSSRIKIYILCMVTMHTNPKSSLLKMKLATKKFIGYRPVHDSFQLF